MGRDIYPCYIRVKCSIVHSNTSGGGGRRGGEEEGMDVSYI